MTTTTLRGMTWAHERAHESLLACADFVRARLGVEVEWSARSLLDFGDRPVHTFAADYDLLVIDHPHVADAVTAGALLALDERLDPADLEQLERESVGASHESYRFAGHQWALAIDAAAQVCAVRADLVHEIPVFWDEVLEHGRAGRLLWPYAAVDGFSTFATLIAQAGTPIGTGNRFAEPEHALRALEFMLRLAEVVPAGCADMNPIEAAEALCRDDGFAVAAPLFGYSNYSRAGFRAVRLEYHDVPSFDGRAHGALLGGAGIAVSAHSRLQDAAVRTASLLASGTVQRDAYGPGGGQPGNIRAWVDPRLNATASGFFARTHRTLDGAWMRPRALGWPRLQFESSLVIRRVLVDRRLGDDVVADFDRLWDRFLDESAAA